MFSVITLPNHKAQLRRSHKKSREGCLACKARRLKCDESKPVCGNCLKHFVDPNACEYGSVPAASETQSLAIMGESHLKVNTRKKISEASKNRESEDLVLRCSPSRSIAGDLVDPFRTHPPTIVKGVDMLMKHYLQTVVYSSFPWQPPSETNPTTKYYVPLVWSDTVLFHATLQLTLVRSKARGIDIPGAVWPQLSGETIRLLRKRVEAGGTPSGVLVSDQTISAVATLAAIEHERGDLKMLRIHLGGLERMVRIRGGLNAIRETNPMVANSVFWIFVVAMYEVPFPSLDPVIQPFFPGDHGLTTPFVASHFEDIAPGPSGSPCTKYLDVGLIRPVALILNSVQHVSQLVPSQEAYTSASSSLVILTRLCTLLSHLLSLPPIQTPLLTQNYLEAAFSASLSECARLAILLHVFTPWCGLPPDGTLAINHLLHRLIKSLRELLANPMMTHNILVLWIFAVGGVASAGTPERRWFANHIRCIADDMAIETWVDMKASLSQGIWHEQLCERPHRLLWEEIVSGKKLLESA